MTFPPPRATRFLEQMLLANIVIHAAAIATMGLILMAALPGGPTKDDAVRVAFIAEHPWLWRLGLGALAFVRFCDLLMGVSLVTTRWVPRLPAVLTLLVTVCAVIPEQMGEMSWVCGGVLLAQEVQRSGELEQYLQFEAWAFHLAVVVGASIYMVMALGWTWCFIAAGTWNRLLSWITPFTWGLLVIGSVGLLLPEAFQPGETLVGVTNGIGFLLLEAWLILVAEAVLRRSRADEAHGRMAPWRCPWGGCADRVLGAVANSRFVRNLCEWLPVPAFRSDIRDVIYCNYLVEADRLLPLVPAGLELQRLGPNGEWALFTHLTYRHGHFGPAFLGPFRRLLPSPVQTNWRIYVRDKHSGRTGIYFVTNAISSLLYALAARLLTEGMPMHALAEGSVAVGSGNEVSVRVDPGSGSGPDLEADLRPGPAELPPPFEACWSSHRAFLEYAVPQDRAFSVQRWYEQLTWQEIELGISVDECQPLTGRVFSKAAKALLGQPACVSFRVPSVAFRFKREERDRLVSD